MIRAITSNHDTIARAFDHFRRTGEPLWDLYADDLVFVTRGEIAGPLEFHGHDGFRKALAEFAESWAEMRPELIEAEEVGHGGVALDVDEGWAVWFRDGKVARMEQHGSHEAAEASLGGQTP
jgi:ketosteroid isomerase-like protein